MRRGSVGARRLSADGELTGSWRDDDVELAGCGHDGFRKSLIIRWSFSMGVETWTFFDCVSTVRFITD